MPRDVQAAFQAWLCNLGGQADSVDCEVLYYITSVLEDPDETSLDVLTEIFSSSFDVFLKLSQDEQTQSVLTLLQDVQAMEQTPPSSNNCPDSSVDFLVSTFKQAAMHCHQQQACTDITNTHSSSSKHITTGKACSQQEDQGPDLAPLLELCPAGTSEEFATHLLQHRFNGDMQAAANWLLECCDVLEQQEQWQQLLQEQQAAREEAERQKQLSKKQMIDRFDLQVVSTGTSKKAGREVDILPTKKKGQQESKVRYRDGQIVSSKGEKYIIEKVGEEWDGGSKGKVYTKGKRGKGFV